MISMQFSDSNIASELLESVDAVIEDESNTPASIIESDSDWYIRCNVQFKSTSYPIHAIHLEAYLEGMGPKAEISDPIFSDVQLFSSERMRYNFQIHCGKKSVSEGVYRVSIVINLRDNNSRPLLVGFMDVGLIQIY